MGIIYNDGTKNERKILVGVFVDKAFEQSEKQYFNIKT